MRKEMNDNRDDFDQDGPDFGPDADVVPDEDPAFDAWIRKMAPTLNAPNATPKLEMWAAIQAARRTAAAPARRRTPWFLISAIAAALLVGVAIDRVALQRPDRKLLVYVDLFRDQLAVKFEVPDLVSKRKSLAIWMVQGIHPDDRSPVLDIDHP